MSDYIAVKQHVTMEFNCYSCKSRLEIDPNVPEEVKMIETWLKLQNAAGESLGFCGMNCLVEHVNGAPKIEIVNG